MESNTILALNREIVINDYQSAIKKNKELFITGDVRSSSEYTFPNQIEDATRICMKFYETSVRAISIIKRTKVGMDGLGIEIAVKLATHSDDNFVIHRNNILFITGMSNKLWEDDLKEKMPSCFKENVFHHGKLQNLKLKLKNIKNAVIIIDEIDSGDKTDQKLHLLLMTSGILDMNYMEENNVRFVFVSATMIHELHDLYKWGNKHYTFYMTIPESYIGHKEFLERGIIQEYYSIHNNDTANKWIQEDILQHYGSDYRVHIIRTDNRNIHHIEIACIQHDVEFKNHTSDDRISYEELSAIFDNITKHVVIAVKGFYRRANLIPNEWKKKIGATHERFVKKYDTNVQVQGLPGRMTGYWKQEILNGHKTGPHRTSIDAIHEYEEFYKNPFGDFKYNTTGPKKLFVNTKCIKNLIPMSEKSSINNKRVPIVINVLDTNITSLKEKVERKEQIDYILLLLRSFINSPEPAKMREKYTELYHFMSHPDVVCVQISEPNSNGSYKKHILDVVNAYHKNKPYSVDLKKKDKAKSNWQCFIDNKENRLCFVLWSILSVAEK